MFFASVLRGSSSSAASTQGSAAAATSTFVPTTSLPPPSSTPASAEVPAKVIPLALSTAGGGKMYVLENEAYHGAAAAAAGRKMRGGKPSRHQADLTPTLADFNVVQSFDVLDRADVKRQRKIAAKLKKGMEDEWVVVGTDQQRRDS